MTDIYSKDKRSQIMAAVKGRDTRPERQVRKLVHALGFRFRLHRSELPGKPDMVFPRFRKVILVHGCFWHQHPGCRRATTPVNNREFWERKLARNVKRDVENLRRLEAEGWSTLVVWECQLRCPEDVKARIKLFLTGEQV